MLQGVGSYSSDSTTRLSQMLSKLDTNNDGTIDKAEFVAGAPADVSSTDAGQLFDTLDTSKSGSMSSSDLATAFQQMGSQMQAALIQAQSDSSSTATSSTTSTDGTSSGTVQEGHHHGHHGHGGGAKLFDSLDTNGDGTVSKDEFVAGAPQGVSADQASAFFDQISNGNGDSLTKDQFVSGLKTAASDQDQDDATSSTSTSATASSSSAASSTDPGALLDQVLAMLQSGAQSTAAPNDPSQMFASLDTNGDGTVSKDEFVAGAPQGVSADQAGAFFDKISNGNGDSLTKDQFVSGLQNAGPPDQSGGTATAGSDPGQLLDQLLAAVTQASGGTTAASTTTASTTAASTTAASTTSTDGLTTAQTDAAQLLDQFMRAVGTYQNTAFQSQFNQASLNNSAFLTTSVAA